MEEKNQIFSITEHPVVSNTFSVFSLLINLMWGILYTIYLQNVNYDNVRCGTVTNWSKAMMVLGYVMAGIEFIRIILAIFIREVDSIAKKTCMSFKFCAAGIAGTTILIGITATFKNSNDSVYCGNFNNLNLGFVIAEWTLVGLGFCAIFIALMVAACGVAVMATAKDSDIEEMENEIRRQNQKQTPENNEEQQNNEQREQKQERQEQEKQDQEKQELEKQEQERHEQKRQDQERHDNEKIENDKNKNDGAAGAGIHVEIANLDVNAQVHLDEHK